MSDLSFGITYAPLTLVFTEVAGAGISEGSMV